MTFAMELSIKVLLIKGGKWKFKGKYMSHELRNLAERISSKRKAELEKIYEQSVGEYTNAKCDCYAPFEDSCRWTLPSGWQGNFPHSAIANVSDPIEREFLLISGRADVEYDREKMKGCLIPKGKGFLDNDEKKRIKELTERTTLIEQKHNVRIFPIFLDLWFTLECMEGQYNNSRYIWQKRNEYRPPQDITLWLIFIRNLLNGPLYSTLLDKYATPT